MRVLLGGLILISMIYGCYQSINRLIRRVKELEAHVDYIYGEVHGLKGIK